LPKVGVKEYRIKLNDGRRLCWSLYGDPQGLPAFYCHGFPSSRLEAALGHEAARAQGICLIAVDRPGYGGSDFAPARQLVDWPRDLAELADVMGLTRFAVVGTSGGGPYALACARFLSDRLTCVVLICPLGPVEALQGRPRMNPAARALVAMTLRRIALVQWLYRRLGPLAVRLGIETLLRAYARQANPADREVLSLPAVRLGLAAATREAFRQGGDGPALDLGLYRRDWGFDPGAIDIPVQLWHGELDDLLPPASGRWLAGRLPRCEARFIPAEGHFSLPIRHMGQILASLRRAVLGSAG
jgi:pimeloyl-ACP methyl ester carboxylesterase